VRRREREFGLRRPDGAAQRIGKCTRIDIVRQEADREVAARREAPHAAEVSGRYQPARHKHGRGLSRHQHVHQFRGLARVAAGRDERQLAAMARGRLREIAYDADA